MLFHDKTFCLLEAYCGCISFAKFWSYGLFTWSVPELTRLCEIPPFLLFPTKFHFGFIWEPSWPT
jgi:hypothetical protein